MTLHMILGIDIGGTSVKFGIVSGEGQIIHHQKFDTAEWVNHHGFIESLIAEIKNCRVSFPEIKGVGIGFPGLLSADRRKVIMLPNIPSVENVPVMDLLEKELPGLLIKIENDAKCAVLGEYHFGENKGLDNFMLIALGTGVGSGAIINRKIFLGARGNAMEIGHIYLPDGKTLEQHVGLNHLFEYASEVISKAPEDSTKLKGTALSGVSLYNAAKAGDVNAIAIYNYAGNLIGETLTSVIRVLDITTILFGGGISEAFEFIVPSVKQRLTKNLPPYYSKDLILKKASMRNDAGLLGAAALIMDEAN
jgi:glucokinase